MTLVKKLTRGIAEVGLALALTACGVPSSGDATDDSIANDPAKVYPETDIEETNFGDGLSGKVDYEVCGKDPNGRMITKIDGDANGVPYSFSSQLVLDEGKWCYFLTEVPIVDGENTINATAYNEDGADPTPAESYFTSATETEARGKIEEILNARQNEYQNFIKDELGGFTVTCGTPFNFPIDYDIDLLSANPKNHAIIEYISSTDNLTDKITNKQKLDCAGVPNLYTSYLPTSEIESRLNDFINKSFPFPYP